MDAQEQTIRPEITPKDAEMIFQLLAGQPNSSGTYPVLMRWQQQCQAELAKLAEQANAKPKRKKPEAKPVPVPAPAAAKGNAPA